MEVAAGYEILDRRRATFTLAAYDRGQSLIIDPTVSFTSILAGNNRDLATGIAVDPNGNAYIVGTTLSSNFSCNIQCDQGFEDAFVAKMSPTGSLLFITYLGGRIYDSGSGIAADSTGAYVTGTTSSDNFPAQAPISFPSSKPGLADAFISKITPDGNSIIYSTFLGGSAPDYGESVAVDAERSAYVVGSTNSANFPHRERGFPDQDSHLGGPSDAFLVKVDPQGTSLIYSTHIGGSGVEMGWSVAVNAHGVFTSGISGSSDFLPVIHPNQGCGAFVFALQHRGTEAVRRLFGTGRRFTYGDQSGC